MKWNLFFVILASLILVAGCYNPQQDIGTLTPKKNEKTGKWGYVDENGKKIVRFKYDHVENFSEGLAKILLNGEYGYIDMNGKEVIPLKYKNAGNFSEDLAWVRSSNNLKYGFIDKFGNEVILPKYDKAYNFSDGLAKVMVLRGKDEYYGLIDKNGKAITPLKYKSIGNFSEGMAWVQSGIKFGYIDKSGKEVIPLKFDGADDFFEGLAYVTVVTHSGSWGWQNYYYIDKTGKYINKTGTFELCKSPLMSYIRQMNNYRLTLNKSSQSSVSFNIKRPYLITKAKGNKCEDIYFKNYSEGNTKTFNGHSLNDLKTLILIYEYLDDRQSYGYDNKIRYTLESFGMYIIYFDMITKKIIGYDNMRGKDLPNTVSANQTYSNGNRSWSIDDIVNKIKSHGIITP